jgi:RHS repeat-associated protein
MAATITEGANSASFTYDSEHQRLKQVTTGTGAGTTTYLNDPVSGAMEEAFNGGSGLVWRDYIMADGHMVALRTQGSSTAPPAWKSANWGSFNWTAGSTPSAVILYFTLDHLGSISVITDSSGNVVERDSYDPWGKRRNADGTPANCGAITSATTRGFTGQEMMDGLCTINFNARIYDPTLGRFMTADPTTETVYDLQILNRYSYVGNNPLSLTDPTGLCFLGCFWKQSWFRDIIAIAVVFVLQQYEVLPTIGAELGLTTTSAALATVVNGGILGGIAGFISTGTARGAALGILQGGLFAEAGNLLQDAGDAGFGGIGADASRILAHGLVGGLVSEVAGGNFGSGFLAAGVSALGPEPNGPQTPEETAEGTIEHAVLGGVGSLLGGGKFANGAITGAFAYAASSLGQGDAASDNDTSNDNAPASNLSPSQPSVSGPSSDDPISSEMNQLNDQQDDSDIESVTVVGQRMAMSAAPLMPSLTPRALVAASAALVRWEIISRSCSAKAFSN